MVRLEKLASLLDKCSEFIGNSVAWLTLVMMLLTCIVVLLRYVFNIGSIGLQEAVIYLHGTVFMLGIAVTLKDRGHVSVDIFYSRLGRKGRALVDIGGTLIFLIPLSLFLFWVSFDYVSFSWSLREGSAEPGGLPGVFVLKTLIPLLSAQLFLQGISELIKNLCLLSNDTSPVSDSGKDLII